MSNDVSKYNFDFTGEGDIELFKESVTSAQLVSKLDDPTIVEAQFAIPYEKSKKLSLEKLPQTMKITIDEKIIFKGNICSSQLKGKSKIIITFKDNLQLLDNLNCEFFKQDMTQEEIISEVLIGSEFTSNFIGSFSTQVKSYHVEMFNATQLLDRLASEFAFHYKYQPRTDKIDFIKIGEKIEEIQLSTEDKINILTNEQTSEQMTDDIEYTYLTSGSSELKTENLTASKVASAYKDLSKSGSFKARSKWPSAKGKYKYRFSTKKKFEAAKDSLVNMSLKESYDQDSILIEMFKLKGLPGDLIKLKEAGLGQIQDGSYLIKSISINFSSTVPRIIIEGVRP